MPTLTTDEALEIIQREADNPTVAIADAITAYREMSALIDEARAVQQVAKDSIGQWMVELGQDRLQTDAGQCYTTKPSVRVSYDTKYLEKLYGRDDLTHILHPARRESEVPGSLVIRG